MKEKNSIQLKIFNEKWKELKQNIWNHIQVIHCMEDFLSNSNGPKRIVVEKDLEKWNLIDHHWQEWLRNKLRICIRILCYQVCKIKIWEVEFHHQRITIFNVQELLKIASKISDPEIKNEKLQISHPMNLHQNSKMFPWKFSQAKEKGQKIKINW